MRLPVSNRIRTIVLMIGIFGLAVPPTMSEEAVAPGPFSDAECVTCHAERDPGLIKQWREGPHSPASKVGCSSCHGDRHKDSNQKARKDHSCTGCHAGPASHSYSTSKHGVINHLEETRQDWKQPLQRGNYRAPGCSYCHLHNNDHSDTMAPERGPELSLWICAGCHSPRYAREQLASGKRLLQIADLKLKEGEELIASIVDAESETLAKLHQSLIQHRHNVLLGAGHQSPDYQWWHGQPALDGDLIRIRNAIQEIHVRKQLNTSPSESSK